MREFNAPREMSSSACVGHLVNRALTFFDTNREAAWRCLRDASMLLGTDPAGSRVDARVSDTRNLWKRMAAEGQVGVWCDRPHRPRCTLHTNMTRRFKTSRFGSIMMAAR
jgi:hypothetical protein